MKTNIIKMVSNKDFECTLHELPNGQFVVHSLRHSDGAVNWTRAFDDAKLALRIYEGTIDIYLIFMQAGVN